MEIERIPLGLDEEDLEDYRKHRMKRPLGCIDLDPATRVKVGSECERRYMALAPGRKYSCPNLKTGECERGAFLYPRRWARKGGYFHFHQGIDLSADEGTPILSVTAGEVINVTEWDGSTAGYGHAVAVYDPDTGRTFWYAHCQTVLVTEGMTVSEKQPIATVGNSGKASSPHLHFEVLEGKGRPIGGAAQERGLGNDDGPRLDPLAVLEELGPWGGRHVKLPDGAAADALSVTSAHHDVETSGSGAFPLGANNLWHGGVHLPMAEGTKVVAPFGGTIVAARLDPDLASARGAFGDTNFILLRHEISQGVFNRLQGKTDEPTSPGGSTSKKKGKTPKADSVGQGGTNPPDLVEKVKARLHELVDPDTNEPFFDAERSDDLVAAINAYLRFIGFQNPDGNITVGQRTWNALFPPTPTDDPESPGPTPSTPKREVDAERVIYCLLMHLAPRSLDGTLADAIPWLRNVSLEPQPGDPTRPPEDDPKVIAEDKAESRYDLDEDVGKPGADGGADGADGKHVGGDPKDVEWVQKRLKRFGLYAGDIDGVFTDALRDAIAAFQAQHVRYYKKHPDQTPPGWIKAGGDTHKALRKTVQELSGGKSKGPSIDPVLAHRLQQRRPDGTTAVVTNLGVRVSAGGALWFSGKAAGFEGDFRLGFRPYPSVDSRVATC